MRIFAMIILGMFFVLGGNDVNAGSSDMTIESQIVEHGGGCRKSSPTGQCCHMDNSTGMVHCH